MVRVQASGLDMALSESEIETAGAAAGGGQDLLWSNTGAAVYTVGVALGLLLTLLPTVARVSARRYRARMSALFLEPGESLEAKPHMDVPPASIRMAWQRFCFLMFQSAVRLHVRQSARVCITVSG